MIGREELGNSDMNAIILCEQATQNEETGQWTLEGIFQGISTTDIPVTLPRLCIYVDFASERGRHRICLELVDVDSQEVLAQVSGELEVNDPILNIEFAVEAENLAFSHPGVYACRLFSNDALIVERSLHVVKTEGSQER